MEFNMVKHAVCVNELIYEGNVEQSVDSDITLPDYCPDILRILKCTITPNITGTQTSGDRITADGIATMRLIYVSEDGRLRCFEQNYPFSKHIEVKDLTDKACVSVKAKAQYINCRAVSQRRVDIHGTIAIYFCVTKVRKDEFVSEARGSGIQLKCSNANIANAVGNAERAFMLSEVLEVGQSKPPIGQIIRANGIALINDIKIISNKILIKGEFLVTTLYCADTPEGEIENIEHSMPISQIIELEGIDEDCLDDTVLDVTSLEVVPKSDSSGEMRLLDISSRVSAVIHAYKEINIPVAKDAYSTTCEVSNESKIFDIEVIADSIKDTCLCRSTLDVSGSGITKMLDMWCSDISCTTVLKEDCVVISGVATIAMLIIDSENQPVYLERQADYEYIHNLSEPLVNIRCEPNVTVIGSNYVITSTDQIDVRLELSINAKIFTIHTDRIITSITLNGDQKKRSNAATLTIYFSDSGESVWDIARKYNTTVEAVMNENELTEGIIPAKQMLLIPSI